MRTPLYNVEKRSILAEAKQSIIAAFEKFRTQNPDKLKTQIELEFCDRYNKGCLESIGLTEWVKDFVKSLSRSTLQRIFKALKEGREALARTFKRQGLIDHVPELGQAMEALIAEFGYKTPKQFQTLLQATDKYSKLPLPSEYQIRKWIKRFKAKNRRKAAKLKSEKEYKNSYMPAFGSYSRHLTRPNELWELDSSPTDIYLSYQDEDGTPKRKRYALVACIDVFTRRVKVRVAETSNSEAIGLLLRDCILDWGLPETIKMDNGKDYASKLIQRFCAALDVNIKHCQPFQPRQKPHIERFFRTFQHGELELLPGYVGHSLSERDHLRESGRLNERAFGVDMSKQSFQDWTNQWCENYHYRYHKELKLAPVEKLKEAIDAGWKKRILADSKVGSALEKLDLLLLPGAERKIGKSGITFKNKTYIHPRLYLISTAYFRYNPDDVNSVYVFADSDYTELLCEAFWVKSMSPEKQAQIAQEVKAIAKKQDTVATANRKAASNNRKRRPADILTDEGTPNFAVPQESIETPATASLDNVFNKEWHRYTQEERDAIVKKQNEEDAKREAQEQYWKEHPEEHPDYERNQRLAARKAKEDAERLAKEQEEQKKAQAQSQRRVALIKKFLLCELPGGDYQFGQIRKHAELGWFPAEDDREALEDFRIMTRYREVYNLARNELIAEGYEEASIPPHGMRRKRFVAA